MQIGFDVKFLFRVLISESILGDRVDSIPSRLLQ